MSTPPLSPLIGDLQHQVAVNEQAVEFVYSLMNERDAHRKDFVFLAISHKCLLSSGAIRILCNEGRVDDALCLTRVLADTVVTAGYLSESADQVTEDYLDYPKYTRWLEYEIMRNVDPLLVEGVYEAQIDKMKGDHHQVRARYEARAGGSWTNRELNLLKVAFRYALKAGEVKTIPPFPKSLRELPGRGSSPMMIILPS